MEKINRLVNEIDRKIKNLETDLENANNEIKRSIDGGHHNIMSFGLSKYGEKITVIHGKLEELYSFRESLESIIDSE